MPPFDPKTGYLPPGIHPCSWSDLVDRFGWNARRLQICNGLYMAFRNLRQAGCSQAVVDGSFVTTKEIPGDFDVAYDPAGVVGSRLDPVLRKFDDGRKAMKAKYFGEVFPWTAVACSKTGRLFLDFFQADRSGLAKGVVLINLGLLP